MNRLIIHSVILSVVVKVSIGGIGISNYSSCSATENIKPTSIVCFGFNDELACAVDVARIGDVGDVYRESVTSHVCSRYIQVNLLASCCQRRYYYTFADGDGCTIAVQCWL